MYTLIRGYGRLLQERAKWEELTAEAVGSLTLSALYRDYDKFYLVLTNPYLEGERVLNMEDVFSVNILNVNTVNDWLTGLGDTAVPTVNATVTIDVARVKYHSAVQGGYHIRQCDRMAHLDTVLPIEDQEDLLLSRADIDDYSQLTNNCLFSVNGFIHRAEWTANGVQIHDGGSTFQTSRENGVGIWSFMSLGGLACHEISDGLIYINNQNEPLNSRVYLNTNVDLTDKTVMLVLGGRLHFLDDVCKVIGPKQILIDFNAFNAETWILEAQRHIDISFLNLPVDERNEKLIISDYLQSDEFVKAVINLSQSFIVTVNTDAVTTERVAVEPTGLPKAYLSRTINDEPLFGAYGFALDYTWIAHKYFGYILRTIDNRRHNYLVNTLGDDTAALPYDETRESYKGSSLAYGHFRRFTSELLTVNVIA